MLLLAAYLVLRGALALIARVEAWAAAVSADDPADGWTARLTVYCPVLAAIVSIWGVWG